MRTPKVGTVMLDGTVYAGISPKTGNMLFAMPEDAPDLLDYKQSHDCLSEMNKNKSFGYSDWRIPVVQELEVIFENRQKGGLSGTFNEAGKNYTKKFEINPPGNRTAPGWYRASDWAGYYSTKCKLFNDGTEMGMLDIDRVSVRYVREGGRPDKVTVLKNSVSHAARALQSKISSRLH